MTAWACPECQGAWIRNFVFDHTNTCTIRAAEDATQAADFERLGYKSRLTRDATDAENNLCDRVFNYSTVPAAQFHAPGHPAGRGILPQTVVSVIAPGIHHRIIAGLNPDSIATDQEN